MKVYLIAALCMTPFIAMAAINTKPPIKPIGEIKVSFKAGETQTLRITNKGSKPFTIKSIQKSEASIREFFDKGSTCAIGKTVAPTESCTFSYEFKPQAKGSKMLTLKVDATTEEYVIRMRGVGQ